MTHDHRLRVVSLDDLPKLAKLFNQYRIFYGQPDAIEVCEQFLEQRLNRGEASVLVAEDGRLDLIGFVLLYPSFSSVSARPAWILNDLYVQPQNRRQGIATALLERILACLSRTDAVWVTLQTARDNVSAHAIYRRLGFEEDTRYLVFNRELVPYVAAR